MTGFTEQQLECLSAKLDGTYVKQLDRAARPQPRKTVFDYLEAWHAIAEANRIFGYDAWDRETIEMRLVQEETTKIGRKEGFAGYDGYRIAYVARVRITVRAGESTVVRQGTGYGSGIDRDLGSAHESAVKEAESDAMKRALVTFGNQFGLALYDKEQTQVDRTDEPEAPQQRLGPPPSRRARFQKAKPEEPATMVPNERLIELASQAANKGYWALQKFCEALDSQERAAIKNIVVTELQPMARRVDEQKDQQAIDNARADMVDRRQRIAELDSVVPQ